MSPPSWRSVLREGQRSGAPSRVSESAVAIVGSGIAATAVARELVRAGYDVVLFERGPEYPYPHAQQFREKIYLLHESPRYALPPDVKALTLSGDYAHDLNRETISVIGGSATHWGATTPRMAPEDFRTGSLYGYGDDWPIGYEELEPYYCRAEAMLGVSGTDADNPFAPPRTQPYPLPPFELSWSDRLLTERLSRRGIVLHTSPQARTRVSYDGRPECLNFGTCSFCPIGACYSPGHHLKRLKATARCTVYPRTVVRRIVADAQGHARAIVHRPVEGGADYEHAARAIVVAAGAIESARLLLLSADTRHPDGLGNAGEQVGRHFVFHHMWNGTLQYPEPLYAGRIGVMTGMSQQFRTTPERGRHGALRVDFSSNFLGDLPKPPDDASPDDVVRMLRPFASCRGIVLETESAPSPRKYVTLSGECDRFGDPLAHVQYEAGDFEHENFVFARSVAERFASATGAEIAAFVAEDRYHSAWHHMGTCRMSAGPADGVVDSFGQVHGCPGLFVAGSAVFVGCSGASNPTLTLVALALRTAEQVAGLLGRG